jgi:sarcosine oxidase, subunit gamma
MRSGLLAPCSIVRVQSWDSEALAPRAVEGVLRIAWPEKTGAVARGRADILCIGPTDWLVVAPNPEAAPLLQRLEAAFVGSTFRTTNVSQALARIQIDGPEVRDLLAKGCFVDLQPPLFPPGHSARTRFAGMPVILHCTGADTFECIVASSFLEYLVSWLTDAALEFSPGAQVSEE